MQSFSLKCHWHSSSVNLPSLPRWIGVAGVAECVEVEGNEVSFFVGDGGLVEFGVGERVDEADWWVDETEVEDTGLTCLVISNLHSQYQPSMVWASKQSPWSMAGLPT